MNIKQELRKLVMDEGATYFGVAPVSRFANMPVGHRPNDLLPLAKSVFVIGVKIPEGAIVAHNQAFSGLRHAIYSYSVHGYAKINSLLDLIAFKLIKHLEKEYGQVAYPIPAGAPRDEALVMAAMSNRYAAVCAGLGQFGWSGFVVTPQDGPRVRWISIISELELAADPLYNGPQLCNPDSCGQCVEICPVGAIDKSVAVPVEIGGEKMQYAARNKVLCRCATAGLVKGTPGRMQADIPHELQNMEEWNKFSRKDSPWQRMEFGHGNYCQRCMVICPVGR